MKRRIILSLALVLIAVFAGLMKSDSTVRAEPPQRFVFDTGLINFDNDGETEVARITVATGAGDDAVVQFRQMNYTETSCTEGICKLAASSQSQSAPIRLAPSEAASINFRRCVSPICGGVRGVVLSNSRDVRVNVSIINGITGVLVSTFALEIDGVPVGN